VQYDWKNFIRHQANRHTIFEVEEITNKIQAAERRARGGRTNKIMNITNRKSEKRDDRL
jgi:hypothetical protein